MTEKGRNSNLSIRDEILEEILKEYKNPEDVIGKDGILNLTYREKPVYLDLKNQP